MNRFYILMILTLLLSACATSTEKNRFSDQVVPPVNQDQYRDKLKYFSRKDEKYDGFSNLYQATVTLLNSEITSLILQQRGHFLQWDLDKAREKRHKEVSQFNSKSKMILSLYTAERSTNDLIKPESMWKIYLLFKGQRYLGKVSKITDPFAQNIRIFPYHNRFSKLYQIEFDAPMSIVERESSEVLLTSSLGQSLFKFSSMDR